jgi:hypothetical protein
VLLFRKEFQVYKETKEGEIAELDLKYGVVIRETSKRVEEFQETITINVGSMLKDLTDIKLQLTSGGFRLGEGGGAGDGGSGGGGIGLSTLEVTVENIKEQLRVLQDDFDHSGLKGKKSTSLEDEVTNLW